MTDSHEVERLSDEQERQLTKSQFFLLEWLSKEDSSALGECDGADLDLLVLRGLAQIEGDTRLGGYRRVELTDAGRALLNDINRKPTPEGK